MEKIARKPLREEIRRWLLNAVLKGALQPGENLSTVKLAEELDISGTPIREALIQLEHEGLLEWKPGHGCFVRHLDAKTAQDVYALVAKLEGLALRESPPLGKAHREELRRINERRRRFLDDRVKLVDFDLQWHNILVSKTGNDQLKDVIALLRLRQYRYEYHFMKERAHALRAIEEHDKIVDLLDAGDLGQAVELLSAHWRRGLELALKQFE